MYTLSQRSTENGGIKSIQLEPGSKQTKRHSSWYSILISYWTPVDTKSLREFKKCVDMFREEKSIKSKITVSGTETPGAMNRELLREYLGIYHHAPVPLSHISLDFKTNTRETRHWASIFSLAQHSHFYFPVFQGKTRQVRYLKEMCIPVLKLIKRYSDETRKS